MYDITTINLTKIFQTKGKQEITAVNHVNLTIPSGQFFGLLGPNGAGKTTFIKLLVTLLIPTYGTASVGGFDIIKNPYQVKQCIGFMQGDTSGRSLYWRLSGRENLKFFASMQDVPKKTATKRIDALLEFLDLEKHADREVKEYSSGMKIRLLLARALLHNPDILFLDEPTIGLDVEYAIEMRNFLKALNKTLNKTIIFTSHVMREVEELCERIAVIKDGNIISDTTPTNLRSVAKEINKIKVTVPKNPSCTKIIEELHYEIVKKDVHGDTVAYHLYCDDEMRAIHTITSLFYKKNLHFSHIGIEQPSLEEAFLSLVKEEPNEP